jgi:hypothetical protein
MKKIIAQPYGLVLVVGPHRLRQDHDPCMPALGHINKPGIKIWDG